ncbi:MAG: hypothetical protein DI535_11790 [Citrobacter freundii]|nr:MAG: hypothetical protein DI535_11790 [Citrobacter freundii]
MFVLAMFAIVSSILVSINFISYIFSGSLVTGPRFWRIIQLWTVAFLPVSFLYDMDMFEVNDCCGSSAVFAPGHSAGIYILIFVCMIAFIIGVLRKNILTPGKEFLLNLFLVLALILNILFCGHFVTAQEDLAWVLFGNVPIVMLLLIMLSENQQLLKTHIEENEYSSDSRTGRICALILKQKGMLKYPVLVVLLVPVLIFLSLFLLIFGQKPDSLIRAFTDTYKHGLSQLDYMCDNVECGGHFLCSVGANGHKKIVHPVRFGERDGGKIVCTRQLLVSNAFEELMQERFPRIHKIVRRNYNKVGDMIHRHYHIFSNKFVSDLVYILMKPLELIFIITLYMFDRKPENRIAMQYLKSKDREKLIDLRKGNTKTLS